MELKRGVKFSLLSLLLISYSSAGVNFGARSSAIKVANNASLHVLSSGNMSITDGTLVRESVGANVVGTGINFSGGIIKTAESEGILTGSYDPTGRYDIITLSGNDRFDAEPGVVVQVINVSGDNNFLAGQPSFKQSINLQDSSTTLTVALQSKLNQSIALSGGKVELGDDLHLADGVILTPPGMVDFKGRQLSMGGKETPWPAGQLLWNNATDMVLNSKVLVLGTWIFNGDAQITGNGNILDFSNATIWIKHDSTVYFKDIKLEGLGSGSIIFENNTSQIRFADTEVEMDGGVTFTEGGIYVEGPTTITTKWHLLTFDTHASLTVDGVTLYYDVLNYGDQENIRPEPSFDTDNTDAHITLSNGGIIRLKGGDGQGSGEELGDMYLNDPATKTLTSNLYLSDDRRMMVNANVTVDGNSHYINCAHTSSPIFVVASGSTLYLTDVVLKDFSPSHIGGSGTVWFGTGTRIELAKDESLTSEWRFFGATAINGQNHRLTMVSGGEIVVDGSSSTLLFENIHVENVNNSLIRCVQDDSELHFKDATWLMDDNYTLSMGGIGVNGGFFRLEGAHIFSYETGVSSLINEFSTLFLDKSVTFSYAPRIADRALIQLVDETAQIYMNGATLRTTHTGLQLTSGTLVLDHNNFLFNENPDGSTPISISEAIAFGNGTLSTDLRLEIMPGGSLDLRSGILDYQNVEV